MGMSWMGLAWSWGSWMQKGHLAALLTCSVIFGKCLGLFDSQFLYLQNGGDCQSAYLTLTVLGPDELIKKQSVLTESKSSALRLEEMAAQETESCQSSMTWEDSGWDWVSDPLTP